MCKDSGVKSSLITSKKFSLEILETYIKLYSCLFGKFLQLSVT